jgi:hypothetical protein
MLRRAGLLANLRLRARGRFMAARDTPANANLFLFSLSSQVVSRSICVATSLPVTSRALRKAVAARLTFHRL